MCQSCGECMYEEMKKDEKKRKGLGVTTLTDPFLWPDYLETQAEYYNRKKLKQDLLGAADIIRELLKAT